MADDTHHAPLRAGDQLDGYQIRRELGRGGMGVVYLARDPRLGRRVALKLIVGQQSARAVKRFQEEARLTASLSHPHIVTVYGAGEYQGTPYLALEYLEGESLHARLRKEPMAGGQAVRIAAQIASALAAAHAAGVLHLDLKPGNVFLHRDGRLRVVDFGLARLADTAHDGSAAGTPAYLAPERWRREAPTPATDVWAFGVLLFELACGRRPFGGEPLEALMGQVLASTPSPALPAQAAVPTVLREVIANCLDKDPARRPAAAAVRDRLEAWVLARRSVDRDACPFRGLLPFEEEHAGLFAGRDMAIARIVERLRAEPLLPVVGPSGAGKSSLLRAGVVPRLREQGAWIVLVMRPGRRPFHALATAVAAAGQPTGSEETTFEASDESMTALFEGAGADAREALVASMLEQPGRLQLELTRLAAQRNARVLVVVDQLEEVFTQAPGRAEAFIHALQRAADDPDEPLRVLMSLRDDFLARYTELALAGHERIHAVRPLGTEQLRESLNAALAAGQISCDAGLVEDMLRDVEGEIAALPLLQFAAQLLWERRDVDGRRLRREDYVDLGGVAGALAHHAEETLDGMGPTAVGAARTILLRLVDADGLRRSVAASTLQDLGSQGAQVLERLTQARLLVARRVDDQVLIELAHESLTRTWSRLAAWLVEVRADLRVAHDLEAAAELWDRRGRRDEELWDGEALGDARRHLSSDAIGPQGRAFLEASRTRQIEIHRGRRRRRRLAAAGLLGVTGASLVAAFAFSRAEQQATVARGEAERSETVALANGARAAYASGRLLEARAQLRTSLERGDTLDARALWWSVLRTPRLWSLQTNMAVNGIDITRDGRRLALALSGGTIRVADTETRGFDILRGHREDVARVGFSPDGSRLLSLDWDLEARWWDLRTNTGSVLPFDATGLQSPLSVRVLDSGRRVVNARGEGVQTHLAWWGPESGEGWRIQGRRAHVHLVPYGEDGLITASLRPEPVTLWDLDAGEGTDLVGNDLDHRAGGWFVDEARGWLVGVGRRIRAWTLDDRELVRDVPGHPSLVSIAGRTANGEIYATDREGLVSFFDAEDFRHLRTVDLRAETDTVYALVISEDGRRLAVGGEAGVSVYDPRVRPPLAEVGHPIGLQDLRLEPEGHILATSDRDGGVVLWDAASGEERGRFRHDRSVWRVRPMPGGRWLTASDDDTAAIWDAAGQKRVEMAHDRDVVDAQIVAPDEVLSLDWGGTLKHWRIAEGVAELLWQVSHAHNPYAMVVRDGTILTAGSDGAIREFTLGGGPEAVVRANHGVPLSQIVPADDGYLLHDLDGGIVHMGSDFRITPMVSGANALGRVERSATHTLWGTTDGAVVVADAEGSPQSRIVVGSQPGQLGLGPDGELFVGCEDGSVRAYELSSGRPLWATRWFGEEGVLTHRGWSGASLTDGLGEAVEAGFRAEQRGTWTCVRASRDKVEGWREGVRETVHERPGLLGFSATPAGCALLAEGELWLGETSLGEATAMAVDGEVLVRFTAEEAHTPDGAHPVAEGATALRRVHGKVYVGYGDGLIEVSDTWGTPGALLTLEGGAAHAVARMEAGPTIGDADTLLVGFADGRFGLWDPNTGRQLLGGKRHGSVDHLRVRGAELHVATALGDYVTVDLGPFLDDYCTVMADVAERIGVRWEGGVVVEAPDRRDRCGAE